MTKITLQWTVGDTTGTISLVLPQGADGVVQIMKDGWYLGQIVKYGNEWFGSVNTPDIGAEEIRIMGEAVEKK